MILHLTTNPRSNNGIILKTGELLISQSGYHFRFAEGFSKMYKTSGEFEKCSAQLEIVPREIRKGNNGFQLEIFIPRVGHFYSRLTSFTDTLKFIWFQFLKGITASKSLKNEAVLAAPTLASLIEFNASSICQVNRLSRKVVFFKQVVGFTVVAALDKVIEELDFNQVLLHLNEAMAFYIWNCDIESLHHLFF